LENYYDYIKALHLIFVITWFSGLFYIPRIFLYILEAQKKPKLENEILTTQLNIMARRLWYIITWPSAVLSIFFASLLLFYMPIWLTFQWMWIKLVFVFLLIIYHLKTHSIYKSFQKKEFQYSSIFIRVWNEGATLLLFSIVFLIILKNKFHWIFGILGLIGLGLILYLGIRLYNKFRNNNNN